MNIELKEEIRGFLDKIGSGTLDSPYHWGLSIFDRNGLVKSYLLENDDQVVIYDKAGKLAWKGIINTNTDMSLGTIRENLKVSKPTVNNTWVEWLQYGTEPSLWASYFDKNYYAEITRDS